MTSVGLGYTYGSDDVGKAGEGFFDQARHWRYRLGVTQILSPRWLANANFEVISDDGYLGSPYRVALVFGAGVPERLPRTRTSRTLQFRLVGEVAPAWSVRGEYRYFWDNWDIAAHTVGVGASHRFGEKWLVDAYARTYRQDGALFYSDNATSETQYVTRNRQLSTYNSWTVGTKVDLRVDARARPVRGVPERCARILENGLQRFHRPAHRQLVLVQRDRGANVRDLTFLTEGPRYVETQPADGRPAVDHDAVAGRFSSVDTDAVQLPCFHAGVGRSGCSCAGPASLDDRIQDAKSDVIRLNRDLMVLEEELLFPANTQVAIFVSMDVGKMFSLDSVRVKLDDKDVAGYLYTPAEVQALHRGGVQRLYLGNLRAGTHELVAFFTGKGPHDRDYKRGATIKIDKGTEPEVHRTADQGLHRQAAAGIRGQGLAVNGRLMQPEPVIRLVGRWTRRAALLAALACRFRSLHAQAPSSSGVAQPASVGGLDGHVHLDELVAVARHQSAAAERRRVAALRRQPVLLLPGPLLHFGHRADGVAAVRPHDAA